MTLRYGVRATAVDPVARTVQLADGTQLPFSKLVFATGSLPIKLGNPGMDLPEVLTFRDIDDVNTIAASKAAADASSSSAADFWGSRLPTAWPRPAPTSPSSISWTG